MPTVARYDGLADWYDELAASAEATAASDVVAALLGSGDGRLLDVGCGSGRPAAAFARLGWNVTGVDVSEDMLRLARARGVTVVRADATALPFGDGSFDAAVSMWTHTDVDDFAAAAREIARVTRAGAPVVYLGVHPCFVGRHSRFLAGLGVPRLFPGYFDIGRYSEAPGISPDGIRARVGAVHVPLEGLLDAFLSAGFVLERVEEPRSVDRDYPYMLAARWRR